MRDPLGQPPGIHAEAEAREAQQVSIAKVEKDHLRAIAESGNSASALGELIWNGFDAEANRVVVEVDYNELSGVEQIRIIDDGKGIAPATAAAAFARLGGSEKLTAARDGHARRIHGRRGRGRLRAFKLGAEVEWDSVTLDPNSGRATRVIIRSHIEELGQYQLWEEKYAGDRRPGTICRITGIHEGLGDLSSESNYQRILQAFALYLQDYPATSLQLAGRLVDASEAMEAEVADYLIEAVDDDGKDLFARLRICQWKNRVDRKLMLCDQEGFSILDLPPGIQAPGFNFTAYLLSELFEQLDSSGELGLADLHPSVRALVLPAKEKMRAHFRNLEAEQQKGYVEQWKEAEIYPFTGEPADVIERAAREVFDVVASRVHAHTEGFEDLPRDSRRLSFELIRAAIDSGSDELLGILHRVLHLPVEELKDLSDLLEQTSLESIIRASKVVADRLNFLTGLNQLLHTEVGREHVLERKHLHRIVAENAWIFGEQYQMVADDQDLTTVLREHISQPDKEVLSGGPVIRDDGRTAVVDLVLGRMLPTHDGGRLNLVVELKRPSVFIHQEQLLQVKSYARAVSNDPRFEMTNTRWEFWILAAGIAEEVRDEVRQHKDHPGLVFEVPPPRPYRIWARTWGEVLEDCRHRMRFFQERLALQPNMEDGLRHLRKVYEKHLPEAYKVPPSE